MILTAPLNKDQIRTLIPHAGTMCLLDRILHWNDKEIECTAISHRELNNPLRHGAQLPIHVGIEYCAQAIAAHSRLISPPPSLAIESPRRGYLAVILNTEWQIARLDECVGELQVCAIKQVTLQQGASYTFAIKHAGHTLLNGQTVLAFG